MDFEDFGELIGGVTVILILLILAFLLGVLKGEYETKQKAIKGLCVEKCENGEVPGLKLYPEPNMYACTCTLERVK